LKKPYKKSEPTLYIANEIELESKCTCQNRRPLLLH